MEHEGQTAEGLLPVDDVSKIGVTGWRGRLGSELVRRGCTPLKCDVTDPKWMREELRVQQPEVVVHCAAVTDVDGCEARPKLATEVNSYGTWLLCQEFKGPIVYLSTDYIFDGLEGPYHETARPNPLGVYGWSKLGGEVAVRSRGNERDLIVRTTVLFDHYSDNFVTTVAYKLLRGQVLALPDDLSGSPTYVPHLADGILFAIENEVSGVVNLAGKAIMTRYKLGWEIAWKLGLDKQIDLGSANGAANRPLKAGLLTDKAQALGLPIGDPLDGIQEVCTYALETVGAR